MNAVPLFPQTESAAQIVAQRPFVTESLRVNPVRFVADLSCECSVIEAHEEVWQPQKAKEFEEKRGQDCRLQPNLLQCAGAKPNLSSAAVGLGILKSGSLERSSHML